MIIRLKRGFYLIGTILLFPFFASANLYSPNGGVVVIHPNGTYTDYNAASDDNTVRGTILLSAVGSLHNGDVLYLSKGTFDIGSGLIDLSLGGTGTVSMHGMGADLTIITSGDTTPSSSMIQPGLNGSQITDLTIDQTDPGNNIHKPYGFALAGVGPNVRNAWLKNVNINSGSDGVIVVNNDPFVTSVFELTVINVSINTSYDAFALRSAGHPSNWKIRVYDSNFTGNGAHWPNPAWATGLDLDGVNDFKAWNSSFTGEYAQYIENSDAGESIGCRINANGSYLYDSTCNGFAYGPNLTNAHGDYVYAEAGVKVGDGTGTDGVVTYAHNLTANTANGSPTIDGDVSDTPEVPEAVPPLPPENWKLIAPLLATPTVSSVTNTSAHLVSSILDDKNASSTLRGFRYSKDSVNWSTTTPESGAFGTGSFNADISGLTCGTSYNVQSFALNPAGYGYSSTQTFTTSACPVQATAPAPAPAIAGPSFGGGSVSPSALASILAPSPKATAYLRSLGYTGSVQGISSNNSAGAHQTSFTRDLQIGSAGSDVKALQQYLNNNGYIIAAFGAGSPGHETTTFGAQTKKAVMRFQKANKLPATGFFGPKTRKIVNGK